MRESFRIASTDGQPIDARQMVPASFREVTLALQVAQLADPAS